MPPVAPWAVQSLGFAEVTPYGVPFEGTLYGVHFDGPNFLPPVRVISYLVHLCLDPLVRVFTGQASLWAGTLIRIGQQLRLDRYLWVSSSHVGGMALVTIIVRRPWGIHGQGNRGAWSVILLFSNAPSRKVVRSIGSIGSSPKSSSMLNPSCFFTESLGQHSSMVPGREGGCP